MLGRHRPTHHYGSTRSAVLEFRVRYLRLISYVMTIGGVALAAAAIAFDLGGALTLTGLMLVIAGLVKIVTVAIWHGFVGLGPIKTTEDAG